MIVFAAELLNLFILFRYVLGYEFRKTCIPIAIGVILIVANCLLLTVFFYPMGYIADYFIIAISAIIPAFFFKGKFTVVVGLGASIEAAKNLMFNLFYGTAVIALKGDIEALDGTHIALLLQGALLILYCCLAFFLRSKRKQIHWSMEKIPPLAFIPFVVAMFFFQLNSYYVGAIEQNEAQMIHASNMARSGLSGIFIIVICILAIYLRSQRQLLKRQVILNEKCIEEQSKQYAFMGEKDKELRKFRHDYNKHVTMLQMLMEKGNLEELKSYIEDLGEIKAGLDFISTNHIICDAVINQYYELCNQAGIALSVTGKFPAGMKISEVDLCVILSNAVENAYEAVRKCETDRAIHFEIRSHGNMVLIEITNPTVEKLVIRDGFIETTKEDKSRHGYGTRNMREAALRNGGEVTWEYDGDSMVLTQITLFCDEE